MSDLKPNPELESLIDLIKKTKSKKKQFQELEKKFDSEKEDEEFSLKLKVLKRQRLAFKINKFKSNIGLKR